MSLEEDIKRIAQQEQVLRFEQFDAKTAWEIGGHLKSAAERSPNAAIAIDISLAGQTLFFYAMPGTTPDNADWIRRKRNTVQRFHRSSYGVGRTLERDQATLQARWGLDSRDYAVHGGGFPITLEGTGCVGVITVSGLPQRQDHALVVEVLAEFLGKPLAGLALD